MKQKRWLALLLAAALSAGLCLPAATEGVVLEPAPAAQGSASGEALGQDSAGFEEPGAGEQEAGPTLGESGAIPVKPFPGKPQKPLPERPFLEAPKPSPLEWVRQPERVGVVLDPYEIDGWGQIYSEPILFANESEEAVRITISGLCCETGRNVRLQEGYAYGFASERCYPEGERPRGLSILEALEAGSGKRAQVFLRSLDTGGTRVLSGGRLTLGASGEEVLAGDSFSFLLEGGEAAEFEIAGNMTLPSEGWESGDISVKMTFLTEWVETEGPGDFEGPEGSGEPADPEDLDDSEEPKAPADPGDSGDPVKLENLEDSEEPAGDPEVPAE